MNILQEADGYTSTDRQGDYGHPLDNFAQTAALWRATFGWDVTPQQVGMAMILVKVSRETNKQKRDNLVDIAGYARTLEMIEEELERREQEEDAVKRVRESLCTCGAGAGPRAMAPHDRGCPMRGVNDVGLTAR